MISDFGAEELGIFENIVPLSVTISCTEPQYKRISTAIGAKGKDFAFLRLLKKKANSNNRTSVLKI